MAIQKPVFDLSALALELEATNRHDGFAKLLRRTRSVCSAHEDLASVVDTLSLLERMAETDPLTHSIAGVTSTERGLLIGAMLTACIVQYARATSVQPIDRWGWFGSDFLNDTERETHDLIVRLRSKEVAHFGYGENVDGAPLFREAVIYRPFSDMRPVGYICARSQNRAALTARFLAVAQTVSREAAVRGTARLKEVYAELDQLLAEDPGFADLIAAHPITDTALVAHESSFHGDESADRPYRSTVTWQAKAK
jgi:hypothetical protein